MPFTSKTTAKKAGNTIADKVQAKRTKKTESDQVVIPKRQQPKAQTKTSKQPQSKESEASRLERKFDQLWTSLFSHIPLVREYRIDDHYKYCFDFAHPSTKVMIDIQGSIWVKGGHSSGTGITRDCEKLFLSNSIGLTTFYLVESMIDEVHLTEIARVIIRRSAALQAQRDRIKKLNQG